MSKSSSLLSTRSSSNVSSQSNTKSPVLTTVLALCTLSHSNTQYRSLSPALLELPVGVTRSIKHSTTLTLATRPVFTHGPPGPGPRAANFQGWHIKKIEIEVWYAEKKRLSTREKFKGDLY